ncbi:DNA repair protein RecO [Uruburuella testudinis]|uniref:DNA repair protein RecO n=1 Tax=Uruburuella testudinis TaxID=1282863 RepID=A0ABY4E171_9NEIS|nr:DNA repair protein RecO [Uruburuella testudinis]UOO82716.1 DNA repair protein RecO [Uruburuella testudinis]
MAAPSHRINHEPAFLLTATPWRESSLWLEIFSRRYGRVAVLARSARKRQSELRGVLVPFVPISASWYGTQELKTLHRAEWLGGWRQPQERALFSGLYVNELVYKLTAREDPHPQLYDAMVEVMQAIAVEPNHVAALRRFEWALLSELGLAPDLQQDEHGVPVDAAAMYWMRPQAQALRFDQASGLAATEAGGVAVSGACLHELHSGVFSSGGNMQQALQLTRMLLDFYLPEGIKSRQVLQQLQNFQTA